MNKNPIFVIHAMFKIVHFAEDRILIDVLVHGTVRDQLTVGSPLFLVLAGRARRMEAIKDQF